MSILLAILGIGFLLFIHEGGHFLAARWCGVTVEVFSLGIGPRIAGFRRGDTDYRLSLFPFGAYVRMAGDEPGAPPRPGHLNTQPPSARLLIFSGGIIANFLFAIISFPLLFHAGVSFESPVLGKIQSGGPAWQAGLQEGDRILSIGNEPVLGFRHFSAAIGLSQKGDVLNLMVSRNDSSPQKFRLTPHFNERAGMPRAGVDAAFVPAVAPSIAAEESGLEKNDVILALDGIPLSTPLIQRVLLESLPENEGVIEAEILRGNQTLALTLTPKPYPDPPSRIGIWEIADEIEGFKSGALGELRVGDRIIGPDTKPEDLERAPSLRSINDLLLLVIKAGEMPALIIEREGKRISTPAFNTSPEKIASSVHLRARDEFVILVRKDGPAWKAGLRTGDHPVAVNKRTITSFQDLALAVSTTAPKATSLLIERRSLSSLTPLVENLTFTVKPDSHPLWDHGLAFSALQEKVKGSSLSQSFQLGIEEAWEMTTQVARTLSSLIAGSVSPDQLGGIITIGVLTHGFAERGIIDLLFFLGLISVNLAFLNLLPIPALDGGHILMVLYEIVRGRPAPLGVQNIFQMIGVFFLLALLIFITYNDILRLMAS